MSRRAVKRYEEALATEKRASRIAVDADGNTLDGRDQSDEQSASTVVGGPVNMFGALLGGDEGDEDDDDDREEQEVTVPVVKERPQVSHHPNGGGKRRRKKGKKKAKQHDDEDWYVGDTAVAAGTKASEEVDAIDLLRDPAYIPDSCFGPDDDEELRASAREVLQQVIEIAHPDGVIPDALEALAQISRELVSVNPTMLSADTELKRLFGARVVEHERVAEGVEEAQQRRRQRGAVPRTKRPGGHLVQPRDNWWRSAPGLEMMPDDTANTLVKSHGVEGEENVRYFRYHYERRYQLLQHDYEAVVMTHNPSLLVDLVSRAPYHVDTLLQLGEVHRQMGELDRAGELVERALYVLEARWTRSFKPFKGDCRLRYAVPENRSIFLALFRHVQLLTRRGLHRTALEAAKLYLNLDPPFDPHGALMMVDSLALMSGEFGWVRAMQRDYAPCSLELFPNFALSAALAAHLQEEAAANGNGKKTGGKKKKKQTDDNTQYVAVDDEVSMSPLQKMTNCLLSFPMLLEPLLAATGEETDVCDKYDLFKDSASSEDDDVLVLLRIARIYAETSKSVWNGSARALLKDAAVCAGAAAAGGRGSEGLEMAADRRQLLVDSARFFRLSGAYDNLQIADFGGSATNVPVELMAPEEHAPEAFVPQVQQQAEPAAGGVERVAPPPPPEVTPVSTRQAAVEFFRSLMPWYTPAAEPAAAPPEEPMRLDPGVWDQLQEMLARRDDGDESGGEN